MATNKFYWITPTGWYYWSTIRRSYYLSPMKLLRAGRFDLIEFNAMACSTCEEESRVAKLKFSAKRKGKIK